jgi:hypothetical protein
VRDDALAKHCTMLFAMVLSPLRSRNVNNAFAVLRYGTVHWPALLLLSWNRPKLLTARPSMPDALLHVCWVCPCCEFADISSTIDARCTLVRVCSVCPCPELSDISSTSDARCTPVRVCSVCHFCCAHIYVPQHTNMQTCKTRPLHPGIVLVALYVHFRFRLTMQPTSKFKRLAVTVMSDMCIFRYRLTMQPASKFKRLAVTVASDSELGNCTLESQ